MKNLSLTLKIWLAISLVSFCLYLSLLLIVPKIVHNFFTDYMLNSNQTVEKHTTQNALPNYLNIRGFLMLDNGSILPQEVKDALPPILLNQIQTQATAQKEMKQLYEYSNKEKGYRYVIQVDTAYGHRLYQILFFKKQEEDTITNTILTRIMFVVGIALVVGWFASLFIARYLTGPLVKMEQHVKRIAQRNWHDPLQVKRKDEIGHLAFSIESMRQQLVRQEETQQSMLQNVSHELKTPIMVIRSYAQAIKDGIYPKGNLAGSIQVIDEEGVRLEKLVTQLLYLTRLDFMATQKPIKKQMQLDDLIDKTVDCLRFHRPKIHWQLNLQPIELEADEQTFRVLIENILDNHLRYASSCLKIDLTVNHEENEICLFCWNDGSKIDHFILKQIFEPFQKGLEGKFGLGLTIVQRIVKMYHGEVRLYNENEGVCTCIIIPLF